MSTPDSYPSPAIELPPPTVPAPAGGGGATSGGPGATDPAAAGGMTFVEMMFAVAAGDTAAQIGKVIKVVRDSPEPVWEGLAAVAPALAHLALAIFVIATSWVGWYHSTATKRYMRDLKPIFASTFPSLLAFPFIMLLLDVFLVVCYFILAEAAELPTNDPATKRIQLVASAKPEIGWVLTILSTYLIWNVWILLHSWWYEIKFEWNGKRSARAITAIGAVALAVAAFAWDQRVTGHNEVLMIDGALLAAVLMFRLQGVDDAGKFCAWDVVRGLALAGLAIGLIYKAR